MPKLTLIPIFHPGIFIDPNFYPLLFPSSPKWLSQCNSQRCFFGILAFQREKVVGGIFGIHDRLQNSFQLQGWQVIPSRQGQGIGQRLLRTLEIHLIKKDIQQVNVVYCAEWPSVATFNHILLKQGWTPPAIQASYYQLSLTRQIPSWVERIVPPPDLTIFPWRPLQNHERSELLTSIDSTQTIPDFSSLAQTSTLAADTSFGLTYRQQLIGWLISHHLPNNIRHYTALWVHPRWQAAGYSYYLIQAAIHAQRALQLPQARISLIGEANAIKQLIDYRLSDLIESHSEQLFSQKNWIHSKPTAAPALTHRANIFPEQLAKSGRELFSMPIQMAAQLFS